MADGPTSPEGISQSAILRPKTPETLGQKIKAVFCGDSITRGEYSYNWFQHVRDIFKGKVDVFNEGYNSFTVDSYIKLKAENVVNKYKDATDIIISLGTNDANAQWRHPNNPKYNTQKFEEDYIKLIKYFKEKLPNAKIAITTIPPLGEDFNHPVYPLGQLYNEVIKDIAKKENVELLPVFDMIQNEYKEYSNTELGSMTPEKFENDVIGVAKSEDFEKQNLKYTDIAPVLQQSYIPKEESKEIKQKFKHTMFGEVISMAKNIILHKKFGWDYEKIARSSGYKKKVDELHLNKSAKVFAACASWFIKKNHESLQTS